MLSLDMIFFLIFQPRSKFTRIYFHKYFIYFPNNKWTN